MIANRRNEWRTAGLALASVFLLLSEPTIAEVRTWTTADGRSVEAELIGYDPGGKAVHFRHADKQEFKFPFRQLTEADQAYVLDRYRIPSAEFPKRIDGLARKRLSEPLNSQPYFKTLQAMVDRPAETDAEFVTRMHLAIAGREPTAAELVKFSQNPAKDKRRALIDELLASEDFVKHFTSKFLAELLQVDGDRV